MIQKRASKWIWTGVALGLGALFSFLTSKASTPENTSSLILALPVFGIFTLFMLGIFCWGLWIQKKTLPSLTGVSERWFLSLVFGSVLTYLFSFVALTGWLAWMILALGWLLGLEPLLEINRESFRSKKGLFFIVPALILFIRLIEGLQFHGNGDAYFVYLPAPRLWVNQISFSGYLKFPEFFLANSWETLTAFGTRLMGLTGGKGLDLTQIFAQWCTSGIGLLGVCLGAFAFCSRLSQRFKISPLYFPIVATLVMQIPSLRGTANLAKNDLGVAAWAMATFYMAFFIPEIGVTGALMIGAVLGAAVIGKLSLLLFGLLIVGAMLRYHRRVFPWLVLGGVIGVLPVLLRNLIYAHNPLFPFLTSLFPTDLLSQESSSGKQNILAQAFRFAHLGDYLKEILGELVLIPSIVLMFFATRSKSELIRILWLPLLSTFLFTLIFRPSTEIRYQNVNLVLLAAYSGFFSFYLIDLFVRSPKAKVVAQVVFSLAVIGTANITAFTLFQIGPKKFKPIDKALPLLVGGVGKAWIRSHIRSDAKILSVGDPFTYYLIDYPIIDAFQSPRWAVVQSKNNASDYDKIIHESDFDYVYFSNESDSVVQQKTLFHERTSQWERACLSWENEANAVWDLSCLRKGRI